MKLNVDAATFLEWKRSRIDCVLRNSNGEVLMVVTKLEKQSSDLLEVEFMAIFQGQQLCVPLGISKISVESDSQLAIQALMEGEISLAQHATIIQEILNLSSRFQNCQFRYTNLMGNRLAHHLAKYA